MAQKQATPSSPEDKSCLIQARALRSSDQIYDLRSRYEHLALHIPGAQHSSVAELSRILRTADSPVVVYDSGKFQSDAFLLCARLRNSGFNNVKVIDGGIAAWAQANRHPDRMSVSRLSDAEVSAALSDPKSSAVALTDAFRPILSEHRIRQAQATSSGRRILVADATVSSGRIDALLDGKGTTTFYWTGDRNQLVTLIHAHLAQDQKRLAGPAQSTACSAL